MMAAPPIADPAVNRRWRKKGPDGKLPTTLPPPEQGLSISYLFLTQVKCVLLRRVFATVIIQRFSIEIWRGRVAALLAT